MKALGACIAMGMMVMGCGSKGGNSNSDPASTCGKVAACGGDLVGTWNIVAGCASVPMMPSIMGCPNASAQNATVMASGTSTFNADKTFTSDTTETASETVVLPSSCLTTMGMTVSCQTLGQFLSGALQTDAGTTMASCNMSGSNCNCDISGTVHTSSMGTYTTSGTSITTTANGTTSKSDYCVGPGGELHVIGGTTGMQGVSQDIVATKQ
jgi:hypothetical protein